MTDVPETVSHPQSPSDNSKFVQFPESTSAIDNEIERARKQFYTVLMNKKRHIRRNFLQMSAMVNQHLLETLSYRTSPQPQAWISENYGSITDQEKKEEIVAKSTSTLHQIHGSHISDGPTTSGEEIVLQISTEDSQEHDDWLDKETDLEIQNILNEEGHS